MHRATVRSTFVRARYAVIPVAVLAGFVLSGSSAASSRPAPPPVVVAVVGEAGGVNVLHQDFATADGKNPVYPGDMPTPVVIARPRSSMFSSARQSLEQGPLGHMRHGVLYAVAGTRLLLINVGTTGYDSVQSDALHATGVADSVTGSKHGRDPDALVVVVLSDNQDTVYSWLAHNTWVDLASTSDYSIRTTSSPTQCVGASDVRTFTAAGRLLFSSAGNTTDQPEPLVAPNGLPETYLVGGVDAAGNTWKPGHTEESDPYYAAGNVVRPYETGELFSYQAAAPDSFTGLTHFGGTSGATPLTAGWAARLVAHARTVLADRGGGHPSVLATGPHKPSRGPLADGRFTNTELRDLLHAVAEQHSGLAPGVAYAAEGYGALNAHTFAVAERILDGTASVPSRTADDQADAAARQTRAELFARCG
jgi:hypothetical protein